MRDFRILKVRDDDTVHFAVVARNLNDRELWDVVNRFHTLAAAWRYVADVSDRQRELDGVV